MASEWIEFDTTVTVKPNPEINGALAHHPAVVAQITALAQKIADMAGAGHHAGDFGIRVQNFPKSRHARAFALPTNNGGIHLELTQSLLLKTVASMAGQ